MGYGNLLGFLGVVKDSFGFVYFFYKRLVNIFVFLNGSCRYGGGRLLYLLRLDFCFMSKLGVVG